jgi:Arc/MetJ-type ribon-helix-helix transcriptional regulator
VCIYEEGDAVFRNPSVGLKGNARLDGLTAAGHTAGMNSEKIAVSLPQPLVERARNAVRKGRARSVSAYVAAALEEKTKLDELDELLQKMLAESGGPLSARERKAADEALGLRVRRTRKARRQ